MIFFLTKFFNFFFKFYYLILKLVINLLIPKNINDYRYRFLRSNVIRNSNKIQSFLFEKMNFKLNSLYIPHKRKFYVDCSGIFLDTSLTGRYYKISQDFKIINEGEIFVPIIKKTNNKYIVDVGSNFGEISIFLAKNFKDASILSIEGSIQNFKIMQNNIIVNNVENIKSENIIISEKNDYSYITNNLGSENFISKNASNDSIKVRSYTLESILEKHSFGTIDFLKIDIEGSVPDLTKSLINLNIKNKILSCMIAFEKNTYDAYSEIVNSFSNKFNSYEIDYQNNKLYKISNEKLKQILQKDLPNEYQGNGNGNDILFIHKTIDKG